MAHATNEPTAVVRPPGKSPISIQRWAIWIACVALYLVSGIISHGFLTWNHVLNVLQIGSFLGLIALGETLVILLGGIDLSTGSIVTLVNVVAAAMMAGDGHNVPLAVLACVVLGCVIGFINGFLTSVFNITPLIVTLGMSSVLTGAAMLYTGGAPKGAVPKSFAAWGQGYLLHIPIPSLIWILVTLLMAWLLSQTRYARYIYATGANIRAAALAGVSVQGITISTYVLSGLFSAIAGLLLTAYIGMPSIGSGDIYMLEAVVAVVVGGTALTGGRGGVMATLGGVLFLTILDSLTNVVRVSIGVQDIIQAIILVLGLTVYVRLQQTRKQ